MSEDAATGGKSDDALAGSTHEDSEAGSVADPGPIEVDDVMKGFVFPAPDPLAGVGDDRGVAGGPPDARER
ncbi:hypothetical protein GCM10022251_76010 [Phytohabitans flavus]|uniref:Uncharacterized protein n=1 Tax=Phytohabitans flavus TaxID=1076124 RepID=A0A6F8XSZ6_9ACTN|nr:hypothetical protein Pflav_033650 [Phytohabitans flavus]